MQEGPNISLIASMIGDPARANMLMALMSGMHLTATELAGEAGVTLPTASAHLSKLEASGLILGSKQGRHRYFHIADLDVAQAIEALVAVATRAGHMRTRPGPKDEAMRASRSCYDHLAGRLATELFECWTSAGVLVWDAEVIGLSDAGSNFVAGLGIGLTALARKKRPLCRSCLDWSERKHHLGGSIGAAILSRVLKEGWATQDKGRRTIAFSPAGEKQFLVWSRPG